MEKSKIQTYLGFCVRSRKIVYGTDEIETQKKGVFLIVFDETLSENSLKVLYRVSEKQGCQMVKAEKDALANALFKPAVKAVAIRDKNLAKAIGDCVEEDSQFKFHFGGSK